DEAGPADEAPPAAPAAAEEQAAPAEEVAAKPAVAQPEPPAPTRIEAVTHTRRADGTPFVSERAITISEQVDNTVTRNTTRVTEVDRQGRERVTHAVAETITKSGGQERRQVVESRRTSSGELVPNRQITETVTKAADGSLTGTRVELTRDVNGQFIAAREIRRSTAVPAANTRVITSSIRSPDHLAGRLEEIAREVTTVHDDGRAIRSETIVSEPRGTRWVVTRRVETTAAKTADGATHRQIITSEPPRHAQSTTGNPGSLQPIRKIVERESVLMDGTRLLDREIYRRDVNGDWTPQTFSTTPPATTDTSR
ncbi:hypothetical protein HQ590_09235, partial [bacterium]|nr:hypothetical protein [bacterium]